MGLITQKNEGGTQIPAGERLRSRINSAKEEWGMHCPQAEMTLEVLEGPYKGQTFPDWSKLAQPRLDFVKALRDKGYEDDKIAQILKQRGFRFRQIDEEEPNLAVSNGGKLFNICMAAFDGDMEAVDSFESVDALLDALEGRSFISITKTRGKEGKYTGITWDMIYPDSTSEDSNPEVSKTTDPEDMPF